MNESAGFASPERIMVPSITNMRASRLPWSASILRNRVSLSSNLLVGPRMAMALPVELHASFVDGAVEVIGTGERLMSEVMPLQVAPDPFNVVQLRGVFRQPLDREPV